MEQFDVQICEAKPLTQSEKSIFVRHLKNCGINPDLLDIIHNVPERTRIVKVKDQRGKLVGLTGVLMAPGLFMKHFFGEGNHIGTNNGFYFSAAGREKEIILAIFQKLLEYKPMGFFVGYLNDNIQNAFTEMSKKLSMVSADKVMLRGSIEISDDTEQRLFKTHKHLRRQVNRFINNRGVVYTHEGKMGEKLARELMDCCKETYNMHGHPVVSINVGNYVDHVKTFLMSFDSAVHFYAKLNNKIAGFQSFIKHPEHLELTEGGFTRSLKTYHAYENVIVHSVRYAIKNCLSKIGYGLITNPAKERLTDMETQKLVYFVSFFQSQTQAEQFWSRNESAHQRFEMPYWMDRNQFSDNLPF